jgi:predicted molibdopterin-dependent oxidoreductase YjgC
VDFLVVQDLLETQALGYASVVLPATAPSEAEGTYTNIERRVQRSQQVLPITGEAKPVWRAAVELSLRLKPEAPLFNAAEVMARIARDVPAYAGISYSTLGEEGQFLA